jgi:CPA2 family monovalent cation:H+ antiporter-2
LIHHRRRPRPGARLRLHRGAPALPALVGYLLAGVLIGPFTPGFVADTNLASQLAEIGVMLLMFGVGLHFSLGDLLAVRKIACPAPSCRCWRPPRMGMGLALLVGLEPAGGAGVRPVAVGGQHGGAAARAGKPRLLDSFNGRIAVGWLVVEDLAMVLVLVLLPPLAGGWLAGKAPADADARCGAASA